MPGQLRDESDTDEGDVGLEGSDQGALDSDVQKEDNDKVEERKPRTKEKRKSWTSKCKLLLVATVAAFAICTNLMPKAEAKTVIVEEVVQGPTVVITEEVVQTVVVDHVVTVTVGQRLGSCKQTSLPRP